MQVKDFFERLYKINQKINLEMDKLAILQARATKGTATLSFASGQSGNNLNVESNAIKMVELEDKIGKYIIEAKVIENEIEEAINILEDDRLKFILYARYIYFENWGDIASKMNYSKRYVMTLHKKAFEIIGERVEILN